MAIQLPTKAAKASNQDPRILLILASTKTGKTQSALQLENSLTIDLEGGSSYYDGLGMALDLKKLSMETGQGLGSLLIETATKIKEENQKNGSAIYDFITLDTLTIIEQLATMKATLDYKSSLAGKNFQGKDVVRELAKGAGYQWLSNAFNDLINPWKGLAGKCLILLAHKKLKPIEKESGTEIEVSDIELVGKNKLTVTSTADSIGYLYRNKKNPYQNIMSFKKDEGDTIWGSRSPHLTNTSFVFSEYDKTTNTLKCNWDLIFTSLQNKNSSPMVEIAEETETDYPM